MHCYGRGQRLGGHHLFWLMEHQLNSKLELPTVTHMYWQFCSL